MPHDLFPFSPSESRISRRWRSNGTVKFVFLSTVFLSTILIVYLTLFSSRAFSWRLPDWYLRSGRPSDSKTLAETIIVDPKFTSVLPSPAPESTISHDTPRPPPSYSPVSDVLTLEQIRDIVTPTRGFFSRDFSLKLGWNNVSGVYCQVYIS